MSIIQGVASPVLLIMFWNLYNNISQTQLNIPKITLKFTQLLMRFFDSEISLDGVSVATFVYVI